MSDTGYVGGFRKHLGSRVHVQTRNEGSFDGILTEIDGDTIKVETPTGPKWIHRDDIEQISAG
jgi:hypothetical protein